MTSIEDIFEKFAVLMNGAGGMDEPIEFNARLVTYSEAPGYRDIGLRLDLKPVGHSAQLRVELNISPDDATEIVHAIHRVHAFAWRRGAPLDLKPGESRPLWIDQLEGGQK